ncbi:regulatory signaling modulator protein AmpE [Thiohalobacter sp. IOR34]|uniref:regulatory signaling modulator protein AmpE n=1 Tax=Thiohalobacter sp. IOR34 TaxID=3057176 RepID=UPI0025AF346F|nr:regulatory signaling modulator protein AmpE [Thiohalobacter sp. IOR34]WJW75164.1 regulatory signaling modulator protein AmpE [Thiohalobacter sp. IOR34]
MTLLSILIGLLLEHVYDQLHRLRRYDHFHRYIAWMRARLPVPPFGGWVQLATLLLPLLFAVLLVQGALHGLLWGLLSLAFGVLVLLFCLGPQDLFSDIERYRQALAEGDRERARALAGELLGETPPDDLQAEAAAVVERSMIEANVRIFGVLFWFALLGPLGAVAYRAAREMCSERLDGDQAFNAAVDDLNAVLDWVPARLAAAGYALSGHFDGARQGWRLYAESGAAHNPLASDALLAAVGLGALDLDADQPVDDWPERLHAASRLIWRTLVIWVFVIALLTLAGWFG